MGASTRAITDEELVVMYLDREAEAFRRRFTEIAAGLEDSVHRLRESVSETSADIVEALKEVEESAGYAAAEVSDAVSGVQNLDMTLAERPTSDQVIEWLEHGDELFRPADRLASHHPHQTHQREKDAQDLKASKAS